MTGERDLGKLIANMKPEMMPGEFVFLSTKEEGILDLIEECMMFFREREGVTIITTTEMAKGHGFDVHTTWGLITLNVHSDLEAVGFLAKITRELTAREISVNVVSAYFHDHLFVPYERTADALEVLMNLSNKN